MIEVRGIRKTFGTGDSAVHAVDHALFTVDDGDFTLILGRSGSGKSTLLALIAGLIRPTEGSILINGTDIGTAADTRMAHLRARTMGFVFQFSGLIPTLTALENVLVPTLFLRDAPGNRERAMFLLGKVGVAGRAHAYPGTLSSGEMKRVAIARALINDPAILIADEPTGDLDTDTEAEIMALFRELNRGGITIVMVTHNPDLIPCATNVYRMERGTLKKVPAGPACSSNPPGGPASVNTGDRV